jgi:hypothetical protein
MEIDDIDRQKKSQLDHVLHRRKGVRADYSHEAGKFGQQRRDVSVCDE